MEEFDPDEDYQEKLIDYKWNKEPKLKITDQILNLLPDKVNIKLEGNKTYQISTLKQDKDELELKRLKRVQYDIYNYLEGKQNFFVNTRGNLESEIDVETRRFRALIAMYYDGRPIIEFQDDDVLIHKAIYVYDKYRNNMDVWVYTNSLYVYHFRNNYYKYDYRWELVSKEPVKLAYPDDSKENLKRYFEEIEKLNPKTTSVKSKEIIVNNAAINLMQHDEVTILTRNYFSKKIQTIKSVYDSQKTTGTTYHIPQSSDSSFTVESCSHNFVKYKTQILVDLLNRVYHFVILIEYIKEDDELNLYIYTNTLYVFRFQKKTTDTQWRFIIVQPVMCLDKRVTESLKPFFTEMNKLNNLDFKVDIHEEVIDLLPLGAEIKTQKNRTYFINTIKQTLPSLINNEIKIRYFDVYYDFDDTYWDYDLEKYVKFINIRKEGHYDSEAEIIGNHGFDNLKYYAYDVYKFRTKGRSLFLVVEFFCIRGINNVYGYTNTLYEYHSTRHDNDGYGDWKTTKKPVEMVDKESLGEKGLSDLKKYYKLTKNIDDFNFV